MLKRAGLLILGVSFLATGSCLAGGDPDIKPELVDASTPNGASNETIGDSSNASENAMGDSASGGNSSSDGDDSFDAVENDELVIDVESLKDGDGLGSIQVQWQISSDGGNWLIIPGLFNLALPRGIQKLENTCVSRSPMQMGKAMPK